MVLNLQSNYIFVLITIANVPLIKAEQQWINEKLLHKLKPLNPDAINIICHTNVSLINKHLDKLLIPRRVGTAGHTKTREYIIEQLKSSNFDTDVHETKMSTPRGQKRFYNVIGRSPGSSRRFITLVCHYDSKDCQSRKGLCEPYNAAPFKFLGAVDSAYPCAALLLIASTLSEFLETRANMNLGLQLIFLDGEEALESWNDFDSIYGARALAEHWENLRVDNEGTGNYLDSIDVFILLDLLGSLDTQVQNYRPVNNHQLYKHLPEIEDALTAQGCLVTDSSGTYQKIFHMNIIDFHREGIQDDHLPFYRRNVPILHLISYPFPSVWHRQGDNRDVLVDHVMQNIVSVLNVFTAQYLHLNIPQRPVINSGDENTPDPDGKREETTPGDPDRKRKNTEL